MNIEYYRNFVTIVDSGTISAAATKLLIAQSALSTQLKTLEKAYGVQLLVRNARSVVPTEAGKILYEKSRYLIALENAAQKEIADCIRGMRGTLWIGLSTPPDQQLSQLFREFHEHNPGIVYEFYETNAQQLTELLVSDIVEIAILRTSPSSFSPLLRSEITLREKLCVFYPRQNVWGLSDQASCIPIEQLENVPLSFSKGFRTLIKDHFAKNNTSLNIFSVSTSRETALIWSRQNISATILPCSNPDDYCSDLYYCCPLGKEIIPIYRSFSYVNGKRLSLIAQSFLEFASVWLEDRTESDLFMIE